MARKKRVFLKFFVQLELVSTYDKLNEYAKKKFVS